MQLTRFDRWLREKFVYELHIHTLRPPESVPRGVRSIELPDVPGRRFKHLFTTRSSKAADALILQLKENNQMYQTQIVDREAWYVPFVAPKGKSVTWWLFSVIVIATTSVSVLLYIKGLLSDPEMRKNLLEALELFKS
jgi:hypothetical protein